MAGKQPTSAGHISDYYVAAAGIHLLDQGWGTIRKDTAMRVAVVVRAMVAFLRLW